MLILVYVDEARTAGEAWNLPYQGGRQYLTTSADLLHIAIVVLDKLFYDSINYTQKNQGCIHTN
jgi:hypothetical protein